MMQELVFNYQSRLLGLFGQATPDGGEHRGGKCKRMHRAEHDRGDEADRTECGCRYCELCCGLQLVLS